MFNAEVAFDPSDPALHIREFGEIKPALIRDPRVGNQRNVRERQALADKIVRERQLHFHHAERPAPARQQLRIQLVIALVQEFLPEAGAQPMYGSWLCCYSRTACSSIIFAFSNGSTGISASLAFTSAR